jgi:hypothetical protein
MTRSLAVATFLLLVSAAACADTYVTGDISVDTTWNRAGSPYIIQSDVNIINNSTLTLNGGTEVRFDDYFELVVDHGSKIQVEGDAVNTVLITSNDPSPVPGSWNRITVQGDQQSSFQHCTIEYASTGIRVGGADPAPWIYYCTIRNCGTGIFIASSSPTVEMCDIHGCLAQAVWITGNSSLPAITYNDIYNDAGWNIYVSAYPEPARTINCQHNWWGTDVEGEIQQEIRDSVSNPGEVFATIDFSNWLTEPQPVEKTSWGRIKALFTD